MGKSGFLKWDSNQLESLKKDMLFFDDFYYDPTLLNLYIGLLNNILKIFKFSPNVINEILATSAFLKSKNILREFKLDDFKERKIIIDPSKKEKVREVLKEVSKYDKVHQAFLKKHREAISHIEKDYNAGVLRYTALLNDFKIFADYHVRLTSIIARNSNLQIPVLPMIESLDGIENEKEVHVVQLVINNLPVPCDNTPLDEIIDFRNDSDNRRRYLGLLTWINKVSKTNYSVNEIKEELEYLTLEFENRMKLEKEKYKLSAVKLVLSLPLEVIENIIKINWSKIPNVLFTARENKVNLLIGETKAPGREVAYIVEAKKRFKIK